MNRLRCKVLVIGGGPGGYVAAIRAGQAFALALEMGAALIALGRPLHL